MEYSDYSRRPFSRSVSDDSFSSDPEKNLKKQPTVTEVEVTVSKGHDSWHGDDVAPELGDWHESAAIENGSRRAAGSIALSVLLMLFPLVYLALGIGVAVLAGQPTIDTRLAIFHDVAKMLPVPGSYTPTFLLEKPTLATLIQQIITILVTGWPIGFGIILCRTLRSFLNYKAERGSRLITLEQIAGSKSFGSASLAPINFRRIDLVTVSLFLLWCFSPITTQSLQRIFSTTYDPSPSLSRPLQSLNPQWLPTVFGEGDNYAQGLAASNELFASTLFDPLDDIKLQPADAWNFPKVPSIAYLKKHGEKSLKEDGWYDLQQKGDCGEPAWLPEAATQQCDQGSSGTNSGDQSSPASKRAVQDDSGSKSDGKLDYKYEAAFPYVSAVGIPVFGVPENDEDYRYTTSFTMKAAEYHLHKCADFVEVHKSRLLDAVSVSELLESQHPNATTGFAIPAWSCKPGNDQCRGVTTSSSKVNGTLLYSYKDIESQLGTLMTGISISINSQKPSHAFLASEKPGNADLFTFTSCPIRTHLLQVKVKCQGHSCAATEMHANENNDPQRLPLFPHNQPLPAIWPFLFGKGFAVSTAAPYWNKTVFSNTQGGSKQPARTGLEFWLQDPDHSIGIKTNKEIDLSQPPRNTGRADIPDEFWPEVFRARFQYLLNTYFYTAQSPLMQTAGLRPFNARAKRLLWHVHDPKPMAEIYRSEEVYYCNMVWLAVLVASCAVVIAAIVAGTWFDVRTLGPELMGTVSSVTRNNPYIPLPDGGALLGGMERSRKLADLRVRLHDVDPHKPVGRIALSSVQGEPLQRGRMYY